jgi:hypothetical protein
VLRVVWLIAVLGCSPTSGTRDGSVGGLPTISVRGRVVDVESCTMGCAGVANVVVAWGGSPDVLRSEPTGPEGAFLLEGVPAGLRSDLLALPQGTTASSYAPTLNPSLLRRTDDEDVFGLTVYVVNADAESLLAAARDEAGIDLARDGGYLGQVAERLEAGGLVAAAGVGVSVAPMQGPVRFVNVIPRRAPAEPALLPAGAVATSNFGLFLFPSSGGIQDPVAIAPFAAAGEYGIAVTPLVPGVVSFSVHVQR